MRAQHGVSLGGASFGAGTGTGVLPAHASTVTPSRGSYTVTVPPVSAALLTVPR